MALMGISTVSFFRSGGKRRLNVLGLLVAARRDDRERTTGRAGASHYQIFLIFQ